MTAQATLDAQPLGSVQLAAGRSAVIDKALDAKVAGAAQSLRISGDGDGRAYVTTTLRYSTPPPTTTIEAGLPVTRRSFVRRDNQWQPLNGALMTVQQGAQQKLERKRVGSGRSVSRRVDPGG